MSEKKVIYQLPSEPKLTETPGQKRFRTLKFMSYLLYHNPKTPEDISKHLQLFSEEYNVDFRTLVNELMQYGVKYLLLKFDEELQK